jgi:hypothetical protein
VERHAQHGLGILGSKGGSQVSEGDAVNTRQKPLLIRLAPAAIILYATCIGVFTLVSVSDAVVGGNETVSIADIVLTRSEIWTRLAPGVVSELAILMLLAYGFVAEKPWARVLAVWHPIVLAGIAVVSLPARVVPAALMQQAPIMAAYMLVAYACMYRVPGVSQYYTRFES